MRSLINAIAYRFKTNTIGSATKGLWYGSAPQETDTPYVILFEVTDEHERTMSTTLENVRIQFSIVDKTETPDTVERLYNLLIEAFDNASFTVTGYGLLRCIRQVSTLARDPEQEYWQKTVDYMVEVQSNA